MWTHSSTPVKNKANDCYNNYSAAAASGPGDGGGNTNNGHGDDWRMMSPNPQPQLSPLSPFSAHFDFHPRTPPALPRLVAEMRLSPPPPPSRPEPNLFVPIINHNYNNYHQLRRLPHAPNQRPLRIIDMLPMRPPQAAAAVGGGDIGRRINVITPVPIFIVPDKDNEDRDNGAPPPLKRQRNSISSLK